MWMWLALPWVRKLLEVGLLLAALAAVVFGIYHAGKREGARGEAGKEIEAAHQQFSEIKKTFEDQLAAGQAREERLSQLAQNFANLATAAASRGDIARHISIADAAKTRALPDSAVKADLELKAGGPLENPAVLRHIDEIVTDYPHKLDELKATQEGLDAVNSRVDAMANQISNLAGERDSAISAFNGIVPLYTQAYNQAIAGHRRWYCVWLCKTKNKSLLPSPISISKIAVKGLTK